jgi:hypothetical protein
MTFALHRTSESWSAQQQHQLSYLAEFMSDLHHVAGPNNVVVDSLSRSPSWCKGTLQVVACFMARFSVVALVIDHRSAVQYIIEQPLRTNITWKS